MRKFVICVLSVLACAGMAFGEGSAAHIVISNALTCTGGNDEIFVQGHDYSSLAYDPPESPEQHASITVLAQEWSRIHVANNAVPTRRNGLINPGVPVYITAYGNELEISDWGGDNIYLFRVLDNEGIYITGDSVRNEEHTLQKISLTSEPKDYYLEFSQARINYDDPLGITIDDNSPQEYCYILLRMQAGRARRQKEESVRVPSGLARDYEASQSAVESYMLRHNIKDIGDLTADDFVNIAVEEARKNSRPLE